eukprot:CAMPEP_0202685724 /NCGR_PEP_ID=MMETSP1385-20130828/1560_1 /ASSEMBLY_ACC=CAM_ASM_000861 /TAXON_ID=933848 /ORGANISM="Elphidium margaritaceum" /LENGTH=667 /DNA_ID=CAMNT_0049340151 /DNA_START=216 /DNA_END=2216 /DNA_ORIENTATION=-
MTTTLREKEGTCVDLQTPAIIAYILRLSNDQLIEAWRSVDVNDDEHINIPRQLHLIFLHLINHYIECETQATQQTQVDKADYQACAIPLSKKLSSVFQTVLTKSGYLQVDKMAKDFYLEWFREYLSKAQSDPETDCEGVIDDTETKEKHVLFAPASDINQATLSQAWQQFICCEPTIVHRPAFDAVQATQDLLAVVHDDTQTDTATRMMIEIITGITNRQRQQLKSVFADAQQAGKNPKFELYECVENTLVKGKTMMVLLTLLLRPAEFHCFWIKQAIQRQDLDLLVEMLCSLTNYEISSMSDYYFTSEKSELLADINQHLMLNKAAQWIVSKMLDAKRPEYVDADKKLAKTHLTELAQVLKRKQQKECKQFLAKWLVENAYSQIAYEMEKFSASSGKTLTSVVQRTMGKGHAALILLNILGMAHNRYAYFCGKLRDAMKDFHASQDVVIRILIGRSEKDLAAIVEYFGANNYGEGTTLRQCVKTAVSGSFRTSLLRIAGLNKKAQFRDQAAVPNMNDFLSTQTCSDSESDAELQAPKWQSVSKSAPAAATPQTMNTGDFDDAYADAYVAVDCDEKAVDVVDVSCCDVNVNELGHFMLEAISADTADRLMRRLNGDNGSRDIRREQIIYILLFSAVLFLKQTHTENTADLHIDKEKLKSFLMHCSDW